MPTDVKRQIRQELKRKQTIEAEAELEKKTKTGKVHQSPAAAPFRGHTLLKQKPTQSSDKISRGKPNGPDLKSEDRRPKQAIKAPEKPIARAKVAHSLLAKPSSPAPQIVDASHQAASKPAHLSEGSGVQASEAQQTQALCISQLRLEGR
jgi:hypothetical protein